MTDETNPLAADDPTGEESTYEEGEETTLEGKEEEEENEETGASKNEETNDKTINQEAVQKRINKIHREKKIAEEATGIERNKRIAAEQRLAATQQSNLPKVPPIPDPLDHDYAKKAEYRERVIYAHGMKAQQERAQKEASDAASMHAQEEQQKTVAGLVQGFEAAASALKINKATLSESQEVVASYIPGKVGLAQYLLSDVNGPANVVYLAQAAEEMEKISKMDEITAATYIATVVAPKARKLTPKRQSNAPKPPYQPSGRSHIADDDPRIAGATFE